MLPSQVRRAGASLSTLLVGSAGAAASSLNVLAASAIRGVSQRTGGLADRALGMFRRERRAPVVAEVARQSPVGHSAAPMSPVVQLPTGRYRSVSGGHGAVRLRPTTPPSTPARPAPFPHSAAPTIPNLPRVHTPAVRVGVATGQVVPRTELLMRSLVRVGTALAPVAIAGAAVVGTFVAVRKAVEMFDGAMRRQVDRLSEYSGILSVAQARAELREQRRGFHEAERAGPALARMSEASSKLNDKLQRSIIEMKVDLLQAIEPMIPLIEIIAEVVGGLAKLQQIQNDLEEKSGGLLETSTYYVNDALDAIGAILDIVNWFRGKEEDKDLRGPFEDLVDNLMDDRVAGGGGRRVPRRGGA